MKKTVLLISIFIYQISIACSAFYFNGENKIFAKNFDWGFGQGYLIKNIRGQQKYSYGFRGNNVAGWISKFGSITFNQNGKEFPYGGINEKGLVVEQLWLGNTEYQENNNKTISELEWIQYQLDNYENVDEVIKNINSLTIKPIARIHYFLADKNGVSAVIDFVNGDVKIDRKQDKFQVITNETSEDSKKYYDFNKDINPNSRSHFDRYCILRNNLNIKSLDIQDSFEKLDLVREDRPNYKSYWSIVYNINNLEFYFKSVENSKIKKISNTNLAIQENELKLKTSIYPNPASEKISIKSETAISKIELYDLSGKKLKESTLKEMNISTLPRGNYLLKISDKNGNTETQKLIKK